MLFALEEVSSHWSPRLTWLAFFGALIASLSTKWLSRSREDTGVIADEGLFVMHASQFSRAQYSEAELPIFVGIGIAGGIGGALFNYLNGSLNRARASLFASTGGLAARFGSQRARVLEAIFLAWLCATLFFFPPLFFGCSSIDEITWAPHTNGTNTTSGHAHPRREHVAEAAREMMVSVRCFGDKDEYNEMASLTLSNQHHVRRRRRVGLGPGRP